MQTESHDCNQQNIQSLSDACLAESIQQHSQQAFAELHRRYGGLVHSIATRVLRSSTEAEDATQIVFFDLYRAMNLYDAERGSLRTWILQYAYNRSINYKRSLDSRSYYSAVNFDDVPLPSCNGTRIAESAQIVRELLLTLSTDQKTTLRMIFLEGAEMEDVAAYLQQNLSNVRHHYYRGLRKLREKLKANQ